MKNIYNAALLLFVCVSLNACASGARPEMMSAYPEEGFKAPAANHFKDAISISDIAGGKETNPMLVSKVSNEAFEKALQSSLLNFGLYSDSDGKYDLEA